VRATAIAHALFAEDEQDLVAESLLRGDLLARAFIHDQDVNLIMRLRGNGVALTEAREVEGLIGSSSALVGRLAEQM
jgi:hypothetical protein